MKYVFHEDAGHGWLQVPKKEIEDLGIRNKISPFSYESDSHAFLEEDCDVSVFLKAKLKLPENYDEMSEDDKLTVQKFWKKDCERNYAHHSRVRNLKSFINPDYAYL